MSAKRPYPDSVQETFATASLVSHILTYLDVSGIVCVRPVSKTIHQAAAQPATWAHAVWQPATSHKLQLSRILRHSLPHLNTLILFRSIWTADKFDVAALTDVQSVQLLSIDDSSFIDRRAVLPDERLTPLLQAINQRQIRVTRLDLSPDSELAITDAILDAVVAILTLEQLKLCASWHVDGHQISKYIPQLAERGCGIHLLQPARSAHDQLMGERSKLIQLAALQHAHHVSELYLSYVDVEGYQGYLDWLDGTPAEQLPVAASSKLLKFKLGIIDVELDEAFEAELIDEDEESFDCNYNDWMHVFLSHHAHLQSFEVDSPYNIWKMTDALCTQLRAMPHLKQFTAASCDMSKSQRKALKHLLHTAELM